MLRFALRNLLTRPLRSLLSLLGLSVAIVGMVGLFSVADGINAIVTATFERVPGFAVMQPGAPIPLFSRLPAEWESELQQVKGVHVVNREIWARAHIIDGKAVVSPPRLLFGTDIESRLRLTYGVYRDAMIEGRFLTLDDVGTTHIVISKQIADEYGKGIGDALRVDGLSLDIVGIYECGSILLDIAILMDIGEVKRIARMDGDVVSCFYVEPNPDADRDQLASDIRSLFKGRSLEEFTPPAVLTPAMDFGMAEAVANGENPLANLLTFLDKSIKKGVDPELTTRAAAEDSPHIASTNPLLNPPEGAANGEGRAHESQEEEDRVVEVRSAEDWADEFQRFSADLDIFLYIMTGIGLTIAVLSIVNTMLMSVTERFIEFGILKSNGWADKDILRLITMESAMLGLTGGILGSALGWGATHVVNAIWPTRIHLYAGPELLLKGIALSVCLGILGGLYPAHWASRMTPMDAIRRG